MLTIDELTIDMLWQGEVAAIFIAPEARVPMVRVAEAVAVPGKGLEGDRYFLGVGAFSRWPEPHREVSLIAEEALAEMLRQTGVGLAPGESRRNVLTRGVPLNDLINRDFWVGPVRLRGIRLCQPCKYLARLVGRPEVARALVGRGGLRARILDPGIIRTGDLIRPADAETE
jgi:MOSC domain-containing protein YiiM